MFHKERGVSVQVKQKGKKSINFTVHNIEMNELAEYVYYACQSYMDAKQKQSSELTLVVNTNDRI